MTTVIIKSKNRRPIKTSVDASPRSITSPDMFKVAKELVKERKQLVPDKKKRLAVTSLVKARSLTFDEALQLINEAEKEFEAQTEREKLATKERRKLAKRSRKKASKFFKSIPTSNQTKNKLWVSIVSGGGGPGTGRRR